MTKNSNSIETGYPGGCNYKNVKYEGDKLSVDIDFEYPSNLFNFVMLNDNTNRDIIIENNNWYFNFEFKIIGYYDIAPTINYLTNCNYPTINDIINQCNTEYGTNYTNSEEFKKYIIMNSNINEIENKQFTNELFL